MSLTTIIAFLFYTVLAVALPPSKDFMASTVTDTSALAPRQLLNCCPKTQCCTSCTGKYDYSTYWKTFDHFCSVTAANYHINTGQTFTSGDYFCKDDWAPDVCIVLQVKYTCGLDVAPADVNVKSTVSVDYNGCMGLFKYAIEPANTCGGPPYPGAQVTSADGCWTFIAAGGFGAVEKKKLVTDMSDCNEHGVCTVPTVNGSALPGALPEFEFGDAVVL